MNFNTGAGGDDEDYRQRKLPARPYGLYALSDEEEEEQDDEETIQQREYNRIKQQESRVRKRRARQEQQQQQQQQHHGPPSRGNGNGQSQRQQQQQQESRVRERERARQEQQRMNDQARRRGLRRREQETDRTLQRQRQGRQQQQQAGNGNGERHDPNAITVPNLQDRPQQQQQQTSEMDVAMGHAVQMFQHGMQGMQFGMQTLERMHQNQLQSPSPARARAQAAMPPPPPPPVASVRGGDSSDDISTLTDHEQAGFYPRGSLDRRYQPTLPPPSAASSPGSQVFSYAQEDYTTRSPPYRPTSPAYSAGRTSYRPTSPAYSAGRDGTSTHASSHAPPSRNSPRSPTYMPNAPPCRAAAAGSNHRSHQPISGRPLPTGGGYAAADSELSELAESAYRGGELHDNNGNGDYDM